MLKNKLKIGSRGSRLARIQVEEVLDSLEVRGTKIPFEHIIFETTGDRDKTTPLSKNPADDFFTDALDEALLNHKIDVSIHSAKDVPQNLKAGLSIFAVTKAKNDTDSLVASKKLSELLPGAKIGTSSPLRTEAIKAINPLVLPVDVRGTIEERIALVDSGKIDGIIVASCALERLNLSQRAKEIMPWETTPLQGQLAVVGREDDLKFLQLFSKIDVRRKYGKVFLVGAGPGDPELITLKGIETLKNTECVFYDYLVDPELLKFAPDAEHIYVGKRKGEHTLSQAQLSRMLREKAFAGKNIVRLKGGDPLIFGRGAEEIQYLKSYHVEVQVVPGVSSATGLPSMLGIPLTARGISSSVAFVSGHEERETPGEFKMIEIPKVDTLVFLMGLSKLHLIIQSLNQNNWNSDTPVMIISKGACADEKIVSGTIQSIEKISKEEKITPPALIIVGKVVNFYKPKYQAAENSKQSTAGNKILYLGTNPQKYATLGEIIHVPMIDIAPVKLSESRKKDVLDHLKRSDMVIFTSRFAVIYLVKMLEELEEVSVLKDLVCVVIGKDTAEVLEGYDKRPDLVSNIETSKGLFEAMRRAYHLKGKKIFFPRSSLPNGYLKETLISHGADVTEVTLYENKKVESSEFPVEDINKILFTSPSTVRYFVSTFGSIPEHWQILSKGPHTSEALKLAGYESEILNNE